MAKGTIAGQDALSNLVNAADVDARAQAKKLFYAKAKKANIKRKAALKRARENLGDAIFRAKHGKPKSEIGKYTDPVIAERRRKINKLKRFE